MSISRTAAALLSAACLLGGTTAAFAADAPGGLPQASSKFAKVSQLVQDKCMACHTRGYDLPFYAKVPGIRQIIEKDYNDGLRAMDLNTELVQNVGKPEACVIGSIQHNGYPQMMIGRRPEQRSICSSLAACQTVTPDQTKRGVPWRRT